MEVYDLKKCKHDPKMLKKMSSKDLKAIQIVLLKTKYNKIQHNGQWVVLFFLKNYIR